MLNPLPEEWAGRGLSQRLQIARWPGEMAYERVSALDLHGVRYLRVSSNFASLVLTINKHTGTIYEHLECVQWWSANHGVVLRQRQINNVSEQLVCS